MPLAPHQTIHGTCTDLSFEGKGVVKIDKETVFVDGMFIGEEGDIEITYKRAGSLFGKVKKLAKVSPFRINPLCKIPSACGGCCFQQLGYEAQLEFKTKKVKECFRRIAKMDMDVLPCVGMDHPYYYRNKIQMPFGKDNRGNIYCGFYQANTHHIVPVDTCYIESEKAKPILDAIKLLCKKHRVEPYHEDENSGVLRHVLIRTSYYKEQIMVVLVTRVDEFPSRGKFIKDLQGLCPQITTIVQNINPRHTNVILGEKERILFGKGYIEDSLCGLNFKISAKSFYQTNPVMTEKLYSYAMECAGLTGNEIAFDAYSGIGTIGLIASKHAKHVISVEIVPQAVRDGIYNAKANHINNIQMICDDATSFMVRMAKNNEHVDVLFMDPPRKGSDERFIKACFALKPKRIVYISCDATTLARDVAFLSKMYRVEKVQPFDMFPQTNHVETVCSLSLKSK